jgi:hypothetical protein
VDAATGGRVAYVHVLTRLSRAHASFKRYFFPQSQKEALISTIATTAAVSSRILLHRHPAQAAGGSLGDALWQGAAHAARRDLSVRK